MTGGKGGMSTEEDEGTGRDGGGVVTGGNGDTF